MFCITTGGHERKDQAFVIDSLVEHIRTHLAALDLLERHGYAFPQRQLRVMTSSGREPLGRRIAAAIEGVPIERGPLRHDYYDGLRFMISSRSQTGQQLPVIDGGAFDWLHKLASNHKLVFVASAIGSQLAAYLYRTGAPHGA